MSDPDPLPKGLVFFPEGTSPRRKRRRLLFITILFITTLALIWPVYTLAASAFPLILGLPLSLAWMVLWLAIMFSALVWLFLTESKP